MGGLHLDPECTTQPLIPLDSVLNDLEYFTEVLSFRFNHTWSLYVHIWKCHFQHNTVALCLNKLCRSLSIWTVKHSHSLAEPRKSKVWCAISLARQRNVARVRVSEIGNKVGALTETIKLYPLERQHHYRAVHPVQIRAVLFIPLNHPVH